MMKNRLNYVDRFMMHTELYMLLSGKVASELTTQDMKKIGSHVDMQQEQENIGQQPLPAPAGNHLVIENPA
jgi:hypothetical protein